MTSSSTNINAAQADAHDAVAALQQALAETAEFYHASAINCTHHAVASVLRERALVRRRFAQQLTTVVSEGVESGEMAGADNGWLAELRRGLLAITAALIIEPDLTVEYVINECQEADKRLLEHYRTALDSMNLPDDVRSVIAVQQAQIEAAYTATGARLSAPAAQDSIVLGLFPNTDDLLRASNALRTLGLEDEHIAVIGSSGQVENVLGDRKQELAASGAGVSAIGGSLLGGLLGLIAGIGIVMLPGVGAVFAFGAAATVIGSAAAGAGIGAAQGAFLGMLIGWGVGEEDTQRFTQAVEQGEVLLVARAPVPVEREVETIMRRHHASDVTTRVHEQLGEQP